jgi:hypothetical protein
VIGASGFHLPDQSIRDSFGVGLEGDFIMEETFGSWRNAILGLGLTVLVLGTAFALAYL